MSAAAARRTRSDQHPAVQSYRQKIDSLGEHQLADIRSLSARVRECARAIPPSAEQVPTPPAAPAHRGTGRAPLPNADARRDDDDELHVDVVDLPDEEYEEYEE